MTYEWEAKILPLIEQMQDLMPKGFHLLGLAVESEESGEGAIVSQITSHPDLSVIDADAWRDVLGDAGRHYHEVAECALKPFSKSKEEFH